MLSQLSTLKTRLGIPDTDPQFDDLLTGILRALSARFDQETNRTLARTVNTTFEFDPTDSEICVPGYPIESVSKFELKTTEAEGWVEQTGIDYLIRRNCIISLPVTLDAPRSTLTPSAPPAVTEAALLRQESTLFRLPLPPLDRGRSINPQPIIL